MNGNGRPLWSQWQFWAKVAVSVGIALVFVRRLDADGIDLLPNLGDLAMLAERWWAPLGFFLSLAVVHVLRAYRWLYLLRPLSTRPMSVMHVLAVAFVGFTAIMLLPLRSGEVVRPYLISRRGHVSMSAAFGTIAVERVIDGVVLSLGLTLCLFLIPLQPSAPAWVRSAGVATLALFLVALGVLVLLLWKGQPVVDWFERIGARFWPAAARAGASVLGEFVRGLASLPDRSQLVPFVLMTVAYWIVNGVGMWVMALGCGLPITLVGAFTVMTVLAVGILIPAGPGQLGNFQYSVAVALLIQLPEAALEPGRSVYIFAMFLLVQGFTLVAGTAALMTQHVSLVRPAAPAPAGTHDSGAP